MPLGPHFLLLREREAERRARTVEWNFNIFPTPSSKPAMEGRQSVTSPGEEGAFDGRWVDERPNEWPANERAASGGDRLIP